MPELPILYSFRRCPYAIRARMAIWQAGIEVDLREVSLRNKPAHLIAISPKATVPVLQCPDGVVLEQSLEIMCWALQQNDPAAWLRDANTAVSFKLIQHNDTDFKPWLDRYKYFERYPEHEQNYYRDQAIQALIAKLEVALSHAPFLGGSAAGLADVAIFPFVRQFAAVDKVWFENSPWAQTRRWLSAWVTSDLFIEIMKPAVKQASSAMQII